MILLFWNDRQPNSLFVHKNKGNVFFQVEDDPNIFWMENNLQLSAMQSKTKQIQDKPKQDKAMQ